MKWAIIYDDLKVVRGETEEEWKAAPSDGVEFVIVDGHALCDLDYYYFYDGALYMASDLGPLLRKLGIIKFGRTASTTKFEAARKLAAKVIDEHGGKNHLGLS